MKDKNSLVYAVVFMLLLTVLTTFILALLDQATREGVRERQLLEMHHAILSSAGLDVSLEEIETVFDERIQPDQESSNSYAYYEDGILKGYVIAFEGGLLWGGVTGFLGISSEGDTLLGMDIVSNEETPGLGGRITEEWFLNQFRGLTLEEDPYLVYRPASGGNIDAVTGATQTSESLRTILNDTLRRYLEQKGGR